MTPIEHRLKISGQQFEIPETYPLNSRIVFQGEAEVTNTQDKSIGKDGECIRINTLTPLTIETAKLSGKGIKKKQAGEAKTKSPSKRLRDVLYVYWESQWKFKHPNFDFWYESWIDKKIEEIKTYLEQI